GGTSAMKLTYDPARNIAYLRLHQKKAQVDTIRVSDEMNVDIAPDGTVYGTELLNANAQLEAEDDGRLVVINEALGKRQELPLGVREAPVKYKAKRKPQL
ncbi:MAG: DUF2283 domain-containing protein, partial [Pseudomonadota bacterium]